MSQNANSNGGNQLVVKTNKPHKIFSKFQEYIAAVRREKEKVKESKVKIHNIEEELKKLNAMESKLEKEESTKKQQKEEKEQKLVVKKASTSKKPVKKTKPQAKPVVVKHAVYHKKLEPAIEVKKPSKVNYDELYAIEIETLRVAFEILPSKEKKEFNKNIYKMIDRLIEKKYIDKRH